MSLTGADSQTRPESAHGNAIPGGSSGVSHGVRALCPFCGAHAVNADSVQCTACGARTDPLSRQATQNEMGPWFVRDETAPFRPGCRLETIERWARSGRLSPTTVIRGPSTHQNWVEARRVPGVARLFGRCHACEEPVGSDEVICRGCGAALHAERDRQHLGLAAIRPLPGRVPAAVTAGSLIGDAGAARVASVRGGPAVPGGAQSREDARGRGADARARAR